MHITSVDTARKLKSAGLEWEPHKGDAYYDIGNIEYVLRRVLDFIRRAGGYSGPLENLVWLLRLGQLCAELEKRGYLVDSLHYRSGYLTVLSRLDDTGEWEEVYNGPTGESRVESVALALLWVLEQQPRKQHFHISEVMRNAAGKVMRG